MPAAARPSLVAERRLLVVRRILSFGGVGVIVVVLGFAEE
jgi:hypothetical protein